MAELKEVGNHDPAIINYATNALIEPYIKEADKNRIKNIDREIEQLSNELHKAEAAGKTDTKLSDTENIVLNKINFLLNEVGNIYYKAENDYTNDIANKGIDKICEDTKAILQFISHDFFEERADRYISIANSVKLEKPEDYNQSTLYILATKCGEKNYKNYFDYLFEKVHIQANAVKKLEKTKPEETGKFYKLIHEMVSIHYENTEGYDTEAPIQSRTIEALEKLEEIKDKTYKTDKHTSLLPSIFKDDLLTAIHGTPTDALIYLNKKNATTNINGAKQYNPAINNGVEISLSNTPKELGSSAAKLFLVGLTSLTHKNSFNGKWNREHPELKVEIPLLQYLNLTSHDIIEHPKATKEEAEKEKRRATNAIKNGIKEVKKDLSALASHTVKWEDRTKKRMKNKGFGNIPYFSSTEYNPKTKMIEMEFNSKLVEYLAIQKTLTSYPKELYMLDNRYSNAFKLGYKLYHQFYIYNNKTRQTNDRIKVSNLLAITDLPTYEEVQSKDRGHWQSRIKEPFENALEYLVKEKIIVDWHYVKARAEELTEEEAYNINDYYTFSNLYISFDPSRKADHTKQIEKRTEKRNEQKKKREKAHQKALEKIEEQKIIEEDKKTRKE